VSWAWDESLRPVPVLFRAVAVGEPAYPAGAKGWAWPSHLQVKTERRVSHGREQPTTNGRARTRRWCAQALTHV